MFQPEVSTSRRRPYVIRACNECRRRRCKCDGQQPICGTCLVSGHECSWNPDTEASRPFTKQYIESLRVKIQLLESQIAQLRVGPSASVTTYLLEAPSPSSFSHEPLDDSQSSPYPHNSSPHPHVYLLPNDQLFPTTPSYPSGPDMNSHPAVFHYQYIFNIDPSVPFGHQTPETQASLYCQWDRHLPDLGQVKLARIDHDEMLSRYFNNGVSWLSGLVPNLFLRDMINSLSQQVTPIHLDHYSPLMHCSLLAFASAFSENLHIRADNTRSKFAAQAKSWLFDQFGDFHPTLLPSLNLLAEYHDGIGERNTGYMYLDLETKYLCGAGMGVRAVRAAATQANVSTYTWYCWAVYAQETFSALGSDRPNEISAPMTPIDYTIEHSEDHSSLVVESFIRSCSLAVIASAVSRNTPRDVSSVANLQLQLDSWFNSLPERLLLRQRAVITHSHVLCLHIGYWWITLRLHLPLHKQDRTKDSGNQPNGDRFVKMCNRATEKLVQLFTEFDKQYTLRYFPGRLLPAIVLCGDALLLERAQFLDGAPSRRAKAQEGIDSCLRALQLAGETRYHAANLAEEFRAKSV